MSRYSSFLIRCWTERGDAGEQGARYAAQHSQSGDEFRTASLQELFLWLESECAKETGAATSDPDSDDQDETQ